MRINIRVGGNKKHGISILFFFQLPNNNFGGSVNQSIIKQGLTLQKTLKRETLKLFIYR